MEALYRSDALSAGTDIAEGHTAAVTCCDLRKSQRKARIQFISAIEGERVRKPWEVTSTGANGCPTQG
jgi:hypothetical protein